MATITLLPIKLRDPVRMAIAALPVYHEDPSKALCVVVGVLATNGYSLVCGNGSQLLNFNGREGRMVLEICKDGRCCADDLVFSWHTQCTGRVELTIYIS